MENKVVKLTNNTKKVEHYNMNDMLKTVTSVLDLNTCPKSDKVKLTTDINMLKCDANQKVATCSNVGVTNYYCQ